MALSISHTKVSHALIKLYLDDAERDMPLPKLAAQLCDGDHKRAVLNRALGMLAADVASAISMGNRLSKAAVLEAIAAKLPPESMEPEEDGIPF